MQFLRDGKRNEDLRARRVHAEETRLRGLDNSRDHESTAADENRFAHGVRRQIKLANRVVVDETHLALALDIHRGERATLLHKAILHLMPLGPDARDGDAFDAFVARLNVEPNFSDGRDGFDQRALVANRFDLVGLDQNLFPGIHVARRVFGPIGKDEKLARADRLKLVEHFRLESCERGDDRRCARNADDDAQRGQERARLVGPNLRERERNRLQPKQRVQHATPAFVSLAALCAACGEGAR